MRGRCVNVRGVQGKASEAMMELMMDFILWKMVNLSRDLFEWRRIKESVPVNQ